MPVRKKSPASSTARANGEVRILLPEPVHGYMRELARTGLFGRTPEQVALTLILDAIKHLVGTGFLKIRSF